MFRKIIILFFFIAHSVSASDNTDLLIKKHLKNNAEKISKDNYYLFREKSFDFNENTIIEEYEKNIETPKKNDTYDIYAYLDIEHGTSLADAFGKYEDGNLKQITTRFNFGVKRDIFGIGALNVSFDIRSIRENITYNPAHIDEDYELFECYYELKKKFWNMKIGRQNIFWSDETIVKIADPFPEYEIFAGIKEKERKIPLWSIVFEHYFNNITFQTVLIPKFQSNRYASADSVWKNEYTSYLEKLRSLSVNIQDEKYDDPSDGSYGFRISSNNRNDEFTFSYLTYMSIDPVILKKDLFVNNNELIPRDIILKNYRNMSIYGTYIKKMSRSIKGFFSAAYNFNDHYAKLPENANSFNTFDDSIESCHSWNTSVGIEKKYNRLFNFKMHIFTNNILNKTELERSSYIGGLIYEFYGSFLSDKLTYNLEGVRYSFEQSYFNPEIRYKFNQKYYIDFGYYFFGGKNYSEPFGQYQKNDQIYCGFRYSL